MHAETFLRRGHGPLPAPDGPDPAMAATASSRGATGALPGRRLRGRRRYLWPGAAVSRPWLYARSFRVEGWTIDPLEVWAAAHCNLPHDPLRQEALRRWTAPVFASGAERSLSFRQANLLTVTPDRQRFHLILCNGLLGGPIINKQMEIGQIVGNLAALLMPGGLMLAADSFHGGWKQKCPHHEVRAMFASAGLAPFEAGEGIAVWKQELFRFQIKDDIKAARIEATKAYRVVR